MKTSLPCTVLEFEAPSCPYPPMVTVLFTVCKCWFVLNGLGIISWCGLYILYIPSMVVFCPS